MEYKITIIEKMHDDYSDFTIHTNIPESGTLPYIRDEWIKMKYLTIQPEKLDDCIEHRDDGDILTIPITEIPGPFNGMTRMDLILGLIGEQIFGIPYYSDGPLIEYNQIIDGKDFHMTIDDDYMDACLRAIYDFRRERELTFRLAQTLFLKAMIDLAQKLKTNENPRQHRLMEMINTIMDSGLYNTPDIMINLDMADEAIPQEDINQIAGLLDSIENNG